MYILFNFIDEIYHLSARNAMRATWPFNYTVESFVPLEIEEFSSNELIAISLPINVAYLNQRAPRFRSGRERERERDTIKRHREADALRYICVNA